MTAVDFYFDFISPYSWLALRAAGAFETEHGVRFALRPVVYGALLSATGLVGPAESETKRRYTFHDVLRLARQAGLDCKGPPAHPFRSLAALRLMTHHTDDPRALALAVGLAAACWEDGRDLTDIDVLADVAARVGVDASDLRERIGEPTVKAALRTTTERALERGVFGVPTFDCGGELFWGQDRMGLLAAAARGQASVAPADLERLLNRPRAIDRTRPGGSA